MTDQPADQQPPAAREGVPVDFHSDGLLWLINAAALHPRGYALGLEPETGDLILLGDGREPITFADDCDNQFAAVAMLLHRATLHNGPLIAARFNRDLPIAPQE